MNYRQRVGKFGENIAKNYLLRQGYKIIGLNKKISFKEIDIMARDGETLVFIEVKTRLSSVFGNADDAFDLKKVNNLKEAIGRYIYENNFDENLVRLDFISLNISRLEKRAKIKHYKDVV
ncbi:MAG: YraN family protein [Patescibacteria group bacterium]|nr:YraN family protein [Patescibacteria group bacterium]MDD5554012.1 YraN family protein [Patescibacteria group bacterium]